MNLFFYRYSRAISAERIKKNGTLRTAASGTVLHFNIQEGYFFLCEAWREHPPDRNDISRVER